MGKHVDKASGTQEAARRLQSVGIYVSGFAALVNLARLLKDWF
ncbi:hypothetical protein AHiyo8_pII70360 (plasmid) [Arthrobacter sp. Hiyo8]|nr:hypothetical protein AHiyo8_pII70160 [Arthrobacter sp. Hiyo8]BAS18722.1 hypothetical protein AHiyo8_pII70270 [Arthrobacter sp. Hiyo8]BAS18731.1 hypothetical protein AHiyo8_pII70360 [Arthrobacter sp. Hiyo8]